ncbi:MAG: glycosyltransferase [Desulfobacterales bacterium]|jgi:GT2 family glycosyltransferase
MDFIPVSIIIPNYNGEQILANNLVSVIQATESYSGESELIVVDDASQDNSVQMITMNFPEIKVVKHDINQGFAEAIHTGIKSSNSPIIVLLNSDVRPDRNFLAPLIRWFSQDNMFSVSPLILDQSGKPLRVSWNLGKIVRGEIRKRNWDLEDARHLVRRGGVLKSLYASCGSVAIRKEMFLKLHGFHPIYKPFYYEDIDLGTRAWKRGWQTVFEPRSTVVHDHYGTIKRFFSATRIKVTQRRNRFFYLWLHLSTNKLIFSHFPWILFRLLFRLLRLDIVYVIALLKALSNLERVIQSRAKLKSEIHRKSLEEIIEESGF